MRRIQRLRQPSSALLTQHLATSTAAAPTPAVGSRVTAAAAAAPTMGLPPSGTRNLTTRFSSAPEGRKRIVTDLRLPATKRTVAPRRDELEQEQDTAASAPLKDLKDDQDTETEHVYVPAATAKGLAVVGGLQNWFNKGNFGPSKKYKGFAPPSKINSPQLLELCTGRAVMEATAAARLNPTLLQGTWLDNGWEDLIPVMKLGCKLNADGGLAFKKGVAAQLVKTLSPQPDQKSKDKKMPATAAQEILNSLPNPWKQIPLEDAKIRFAVCKRIYQLTGHLIPDHKLMFVKKAQDLLSLVLRPPPPTSVADVTMAPGGELRKLSNVRVHARRITPIHKAQMVGSWKVAQAELQRRELPVTGHSGMDKVRENEWYRGPKPKKTKKKRG